MSNIKKGLDRDKEIIESLEKCKVMNTNQIAALHFPFPAGLRKAQQRCNSLFRQGRIKRLRYSSTEPYAYYLDRKPELFEHSIARSWVYVWLHKRAKVFSWDIEQKFGDLQCDALTRTIPGWYFIEVDRSTSNNKFEKFLKYDALYEREGWHGSSLMKRLESDTWPKIILVTDSVKKGIKIMDQMKSENRHNKYELHLLSDVINDSFLIPDNTACLCR